MSWLVLIYFFFAAFFGVYMIVRAKSVDDQFLKILLFATGGILILRGIPLNITLAFAMLLYLLLILAILTFVIIRYHKETLRLGLPIAQVCVVMLYAGAALSPRSFQAQMFGYISVLAAVLLFYAYKTELLKTFKEYGLIMIVLGFDSAAFFLGNLLG